MLTKYKSSLFGFAFLATVGASETAQAQLSVDRCGIDATASDFDAQRRLVWMRTCALRPLHPQSDALAAATDCISSRGLEKCKDYRESVDPADPTKNSYIGEITSNRSINSAYYNLYYSPDIGAIPKQDKDAEDYWNWSLDDKYKKRGVFYPTYGDQKNWHTSNVYAPNPSLAPTDPNYCTMYLKTSSGAFDFTKTVSAFYFHGTCQAGCYTPEQLVRFEGGYEQIAVATENLVKNIVTLDPRATMDNLFFLTQRVEKYIRSQQAEETLIYEIQTSGGGKLRVTANHPLVRNDGVMVQAESLHMGDSLVREDGTPDVITSISVGRMMGKVYNLQPVSTNRVANIVVAQGFLSGSSAYQNEDLEYINRLVLRRTIPTYVIPH